MEKREDIIERYKLSEEETTRMGGIIYDKYTHNKQASNRPFAVIVIGQPGAGKSGLMNYTENQFESAIAVDIDDLRNYYPKYEEVARDHPKEFEEITGKFATSMIHFLTPRLIEAKHSLILHKTRGDEAVVYDTILPLREKGYDVILRVMAVNKLESKMSALERSLNQRDQFGVCRWVQIPYHNTQYTTIPLLADNIKKRKQADLIEVYTRGEKIAEPNLQYSVLLNENLLSNPAMINPDGTFAVGDFNPHHYSSLLQAIIKARDIDLQKILESIDDRIEAAERRAVVGDEKPYIDEVKEITANRRAKLYQ